jgi:hypothetical protein
MMTDICRADNNQTSWTCVSLLAVPSPRSPPPPRDMPSYHSSRTRSKGQRGIERTGNVRPGRPAEFCRMENVLHTLRRGCWRPRRRPLCRPSKPARGASDQSRTAATIRAAPRRRWRWRWRWRQIIIEQRAATRWGSRERRRGVTRRRRRSIPRTATTTPTYEIRCCLTSPFVRSFLGAGT